MEVLLNRFARASRIATVLPPLIPPLARSERWKSGRALGRRAVRLRRAGKFQIPMARIMTVFAALVIVVSVRAEVHEVGPISLTVNQLDSELMFFTNTLPFQPVSVSNISGKSQDDLFGVSGEQMRIAELKLGAERIRLIQHIGHPGRMIPPDSRSFDHWFQHIAIAVSDMDRAYDRLRQERVKHVSTAPQTLPLWNTNAAGIQAFYFRDPEDHVLEIIHFPPGKGDPRWQQGGTNLFLGIDHTAVVVADTERSLALYRDRLGLRVAGAGENYGPEQEHLNQVFGARLRITSLRSPRGPGIELLEYIAPPGGRPLPADASVRDLVFWSTQLLVGDVRGVARSLSDSGAVILSRPAAAFQIVRDPDGHALELAARPNFETAPVASQSAR